MSRLASALILPEKYMCRLGTVAAGMEALMVMLRLLEYPNRLCDLVALLGRSESELSMIFATLYEHNLALMTHANKLNDLFLSCEI